MFLTPKRVAAMLAISMPTMYEALRRGQIPGAFRVGDDQRGQYRINAAEFARLGRSPAGGNRPDPAFFWPQNSNHLASSAVDGRPGGAPEGSRGSG